MGGTCGQPHSCPWSDVGCCGSQLLIESIDDLQLESQKLQQYERYVQKQKTAQQQYNLKKKLEAQVHTRTHHSHPTFTVCPHLLARKLTFPPHLKSLPLNDHHNQPTPVHLKRGRITLIPPPLLRCVRVFPLPPTFRHGHRRAKILCPKRISLRTLSSSPYLSQAA